MATLVLTTAGALLGGPIGGAIGAVLGSQVDRALLDSKGRQGPRLGDLSVQTSSYGAQVPRLFGTMRVSGTVIWATPLREDRHSSGSAKAGTKTTTYSYSCSFAVALSARRVRSIGRIWADGNLLRGAAGDWKSDIAAFRLHDGDEVQAVDPLIASAEGTASTPAHRGLAYAVFEGLQLADFGNRIPSLTFEVVADAGDVSVGAIAAEISDGAIAGNGGVALGGYAVSGDSVRGALEALADACPMPLVDDGVHLRLETATMVDIPADLLGAATTGDAGTAHLRTRTAAATLPDAVTLAYYEPARDFQAGLQSARRDGIGARTTRIELPAAVSSATAKAMAEDALDRAWIERDTAIATVPWRLIGARAGMPARLDGEDGWRIAEWSLERMVLRLTLRRVRAGGAALPAADPGRTVSSGDAAAGATRLALVDLPAFDDGTATAPRLFLAAAGTGPGWRRAGASVSIDGGASWQAIGQTAMPATMGAAATALPAGATRQIDRAGTVDVALLHPGMTLANAGDDALMAGANLAIVGDEIVQFGTATQIGPTRFRLSRLLRGRRGSEWATSGHAIGEAFVLLDAATLLPLDIPLATLGGTVRAMATGPGDGGATVTATRTVDGWAVRPPPPVRLSARRLPDGTIRFAWVGRSRFAWTWLDGAEAGTGEDGERYRVTLSADAGTGRAVEVTAPAYDYAPADMAADGAALATRVTASIVTLGARAPSRPAATITFIL